MSTALIIGGVVLGVAVLAGVAMMGKKREETEDTFFGSERPQYPNEENQSGGRSRTRSRRSRSRRSKRVKI
jgi:hypothetical protein